MAGLFRIILAKLALASLGGISGPQQAPITYVSVPGSPFRAIFAPDGEHVFVSEDGGIGILGKSSEGAWTYLRTEPLSTSPGGIRLTQDGKLLIAAIDNGVILFEEGKLVTGSAPAKVVSLTYGKSPGCIDVNSTADGRFLFVSNESDKSITVIDLQRMLRDGPSSSDIVGTIPVGIAPIALVFSPDMATLYNTSERATADFGWPADSTPEANTKRAKVPQGALITIDVKRAETDPAHSVLARVPAGASPVRMVLSQDGAVAYVTVRGSDSVFVFDTAKLASNAPDACTAKIPVGPSPVGLALVDGGKKLIVANSNRFAPSKSGHETLSVIDTSRLSEGKGAVIGVLPAGSFPREIQVSPDGSTLAVTNYNSKSVELLDLTRLAEAIQPVGKGK